MSNPTYATTTNPSYAPAQTTDATYPAGSYAAGAPYGATTTTTTYQSAYPNKAAPATAAAYVYPYSLSYLSKIVTMLLAWQIFCYIGWFIVEIIIHSETDQAGYLGQLSVQSMIVYTHQGIILFGSLLALVYADLVKTRAARVMSCTVQVFCLLAWFWELYFIIPSFEGASNGQNVFCASTTADGSNGVDAKWCRLTRAASAFAVACEFGQMLACLYAIANMFIVPVADDGSVKEVEEVDDAEVDAFVAAQPQVYGAEDLAEKATSLAILGLVGFCLTGYAILVFASVKLAKDTGLSYILSDVTLSDMFRQLSLTLAVALAVASYAALRRNRCITAGALFLNILAGWQWWSFFIEAARRFHQEPYSASPNGNFLNAASKAVIAGAGIIACIETILALGLLCKYYFYVRVQKTNLVPTYQTGAFDFVNPIFSAIFALSFLATLTWWVLQFVLESDSGLFANDPNTASVLVTERMFIYQCMFMAAVYLPAFYAEKWRNVGSYYSALMVNFVIILGYFLLVWPWSYNTVYRSGILMNDSGVSENGTAGPTSDNAISNGFCVNNPSNYGHDICHLVHGAGVLSIITGGLFIILAIYQICRIAYFAMDPVDGTAAVNADGTMVAQLGLPPVARKNEFINLCILLCVAGLAIWALTAIDALSRDNNDSFVAYSGQGVPVTQTGSGSNTSSSTNLNYFYAYLYTIAYPVIVTLAFGAWVSAELAQNAFNSNSFGWRMMLVGISATMFMFYLPGLIYVARYTHNGGLGTDQKAEAAGWLILAASSFLLTVSALVHLWSAPIPVPDRTATVITRDVQLNNVAVDPMNKGAEAARAAAVAGGYAPANTRDIADTTVVEQRDPSYNSTVNVH